MEQIYERMNNLRIITQELEARIEGKSTNVDFSRHSWVELCGAAKDTLQWLKVYGQQAFKE